MSTHRGSATAAALVCLLWAWPGTATAQSAGVSAQTPAGGPLVLQPSGDGPLFAPDVKIGKFGSDTGVLVGGYGGWLVDDRLLLGAGGYWLADHDWSDPVSGMGYFGFVTAWTVPASRTIHAGLRGLVGFGQASLTDSYAYPANEGRQDSRHGGPAYPSGGTYQTQFWKDVFVFEPQATMLIRLTHGVALDISAGYRLVEGAGYYNDRLSGASGSIAVRFGPHF
jgi:hypothetical protein